MLCHQGPCGCGAPTSHHRQGCAPDEAKKQIALCLSLLLRKDCARGGSKGRKKVEAGMD